MAMTNKENLMHTASKNTGIIVIAMVVGVFFSGVQALSRVHQEDDKVYLIDRTGQRWDVTQAESLGFKFEDNLWGIGKVNIRIQAYLDS